MDKHDLQTVLLTVTLTLEIVTDIMDVVVDFGFWNIVLSFVLFVYVRLNCVRYCRTWNPAILL